MVMVVVVVMLLLLLRLLIAAAAAVNAQPCTAAVHQTVRKRSCVPTAAAVAPPRDVAIP
jgi:hypothetical protein